MKNQILEIIKQYPKRYSQIIKNNIELSEWVNCNSIINEQQYSANIYSAITQTTNICKNGNFKKFLNINSGWGYCGHANICKCNKEESAIKTSKSKCNNSTESNQLINIKRSITMQSRYGCEFNSQRSDIKHIWQGYKTTEEVAVKLRDFNWMKNEYIDKCRSLVDIADELKIYYGTVAEYCRKHGFDIRQRSNYSLEENQISNFLTSLNISHECGNWSILQNKELDIYTPAHKLAIEVNGLYWHSYNPSQQKQENKKQHIEKTIACEQLGIELIHITDWEWHNKTEIIKDIIRSKLKLNKSIGARKCRCEVISSKVAGKFLDKYHLQGHTAAHKSYALTFEGNIQLAITIGKSRFNKQYKFELLRLCGLEGITISGGISKLIKFIKKDLNISELMTYCDRSKSIGAGYKAAGFTFIMYTGPGYFWTDGNNIISRYKAQKHNLHKILLNFDQSLSESENMFANKYRRYWDCGNIVFEI